MISKRINPGYYGEDGYIANLIGAHSRGLDTDMLHKVAAANEFSISMDFTPQKDKSYIHLITTGAGEFYGPNNNADYFNKDAHEVTFPNPQGAATKLLDGGLEKYHKTFNKYGAVYREHNNSKKGGKQQGRIVKEAYNTDMKRGELIVELCNNAWSDELQKIARNEPVYWSMGCGVPFDICSNCGNEAKTRANYCEHMRFNKLAIDENGGQTFAYNDQPHFHDISKVRMPADKIAFALSKVASSGTLHTYAEEVGMYLPMGLINKIATDMEQKIAEALEKVSQIEKRILLKGTSPVEHGVSKALDNEELSDDLCSKLANFPLDDLISSTHSSKVLLPPKTFIRIVINKSASEIAGLEDLPRALEGIFNSLKQGNFEEILSDGSYIPKTAQYRSGLISLVDSLEGVHSLEDGPLQHRVTRSTVIGAQPSLAKRASRLYEREISAETRVLAKEYAKYQLSFLAHNPQDKYAHLVALKNMCNL